VNDKEIEVKVTVESIRETLCTGWQNSRQRLGAWTMEGARAVDRRLLVPMMRKLSVLLARDEGDLYGALPPWKAKSLKDFHVWLQELPDGEGPEKETLDTCDLFTLLSEFTTLRQEIRLQNREQARSVKSLTGFLDVYKEELETYRKRAETLADAEQRILAYAEKKSVEPFLDVRSSLVRGLEASREIEAGFSLLKGTKIRREGVVKGYETTLARFDHALALAGVDTMETIGQPFDPKVMRAVHREKDDTVASGAVIRETACGFVKNGEVLHYAEVIVSE